MTVTRDATSNVFFPATATEATQWIAGLGIGAPFALWQLQEAAGPFVDSISGINLTNGSMGTHAGVTAWTRLAIKATPDGSGNFAENIGSWPDLHSTSQTLLFLIAVTATPGGTRTILGMGGASAGDLFVNYDASNHYILTDGTNTGTGTVNHGTGVVGVLVRHNATATTDDLFVGAFASLEKISKTFHAPVAGATTFGFGAFSLTTPVMEVLGAIAFDGSAAEVTDAQVTALFGRFVTGFVASIAITPSSPMIAVAATVQLTAIATMGDSSTQDVTSDPNTVWASSSPGVATVSSTGLVTGVAAGTTTITATYGGATSSGDVVTVTPSGVHLVSIAVTPAYAAIGVGATQALAATGTFSDGSTSDLTSSAAWSSSKGSATVSGSGVVSAHASGTVVITASATVGGGSASGNASVGVASIAPSSYAGMLAQLLAPGRLWRFVGSLLNTLFTACADELGRLDARTADLLNEADPSTAVETLPDYESELAITPGLTDTNAQRQARIVARLVARQRYRPVDFQTALASILGQLAANVVVLERTPAFALSIKNVREIFRFYIYRDPTLPGTYSVTDAQALVDKIKPSHTIGKVIESTAAKYQDPHSLYNRDLLGA